MTLAYAPFRLTCAAVRYGDEPDGVTPHRIAIAPYFSINRRVVTAQRICNLALASAYGQ